MSMVEQFHERYVYGRRIRVLSGWIADLIPPDARVLDVGCGDGQLSATVMRSRPDVSIAGADVLARGKTFMPVEQLDGQALPYPDNSFDVVMFVDVLHHASDPAVLLGEGVRVVRHAILIKDHSCEGPLARATLRYMDRVGNARHGVALPYNYWTRQEWLDAFSALKLRVAVYQRSLHLYPGPATWVFDRSLHFLARLDLNP